MSTPEKNARLKSRRQALGKIGSLSIAGLLGGQAGASAASAGAGLPDLSVNGMTLASATTAKAMPAAAGSCTLIPEETRGPFPLLAILGNRTFVRKDIREDRTGIPLTLALTLQDVKQSCSPIANAAVYIWQCDKDGGYSGYGSSGNGNHLGKTFLRGVQISDRNGQVAFNTIFPGWYPGRIAHIHFQVYLNDNMTVKAIATSQLAFPQDVTRAVYDTPLYRARGQNTSMAGIEQDFAFSDGSAYQVAAVKGDPASGLIATLDIGIAAASR